MKGLNKVMVIGNLGRDPELRYTPAGKPVVNFSVAATTGWGESQNTEWFNLVAWGRLAEICAEYLAKGSHVYLEGHLQTRSWEGTDGQTKSRTELVAQQMVMLGRRRDSPIDEDQSLDVDEIPF